MTGEEVFSKTQKWAGRTLEKLNEGTTDKELKDLAASARDVRRLIQEGAHMDAKEIKELESVTLEHDDSALAVTVTHQ